MDDVSERVSPMAGLPEGVADGVPERLRRLEEALGNEISREEAVSLLAQAKQEAHAEALSLLREMYKHAFLDAAFVPAGAGEACAGEAAGAGAGAARAAPPACTAPAVEAGVGTAPAVEPPAAESGEAVAPPAGAAGEDEGGLDQDDLLHEVEAIRRRIAENEQFLKHGPAPSPGAEGLDGPARSPGAEGLDDRAEATRAESAPPPAADPSDEVAPGAQACYVYGVVKAEEPMDLLLTAAGVSPEEPVGLVGADGLAAVVSVVRLDEFGEEEIEDNIKDPEWAEAKVRAHHEVLNELLSKGMCPLPMQFCTIFQGLDRVHGMLREHREEFLLALGRLAEKAEWGVKMFCDQATARRWVGEEARTTGAHKEETETAGAGAAYFLRKRTEKMLDEKVERAADEAAQTSHETLARFSMDAVILTLQGRETTGRAEAMLLNGAYLVGDESLPGFEAAVDRLTQDWAPFGCSFELTGPWPAYNFARVDAAEAVNE